MAITKTIECTDGCTLTMTLTLDDTAGFGANPVTVHAAYTVHATDDMTFKVAGQVTHTFGDATAVTLADVIDQVRDDITTKEGV